MRWLAVVLLALGACGEDPPPAPRPPPAPKVRVKWGSVRVKDFDMQLPTTWSKAQEFPNSTMIFGPKDDGFQPNLQLIWAEARFPDASRFADHFRRKWETPGYRIRDGGKDTIAGVSAEYIVYTQMYKDQRTDQETMFTTIDWYFVRSGHQGILRCISTSRTFGVKYRPLFEQIKSRLRVAGR